MFVIASARRLQSLVPIDSQRNKLLKFLRLEKYEKINSEIVMKTKRAKTGFTATVLDRFR